MLKKYYKKCCRNKGQDTIFVQNDANALSSGDLWCNCTTAVVGFLY